MGFLFTQSVGHAAEVLVPTAESLARGIGIEPLVSWHGRLRR
jgi:hypothetical protein